MITSRVELLTNPAKSRFSLHKMFTLFKTRFSVNARDSENFRNRVLLVILVGYNIWVALLEASLLDQEWILDEQQRLVLIDTSQLYQRRAQKIYDNKLKFRVGSGIWLIYARLLAAIILIVGFFTNPRIKLTLFAYITIVYHALMQFSNYIFTLILLVNKLHWQHFQKILIDAFIWVLWETLYIRSMHMETECVFYRTLEAMKDFTVEWFPKSDEPNIVKLPTKRHPHMRSEESLLNKWLEIIMPEKVQAQFNGLSSVYFTKSNKFVERTTEGPSRIPIKRQNATIQQQIRRLVHGKDVVVPSERLKSVIPTVGKKQLELRSISSTIL